MFCSDRVSEQGVLRPCNLGIVRSFFDVYRQCRGEYLVFLPSDDYFTSPHKLQKQVDFLERRPDLALCFHRAQIVMEDSPECGGLHPPDGAPLATTVEDLLRGDCLVACATMLRKLFDTLPSWCEELPLDDWPTFVLHAQHGGIGYLDEAMSAYRIHSRSAWSSLSRREKLPRKIETRRRVAQELGAPYDAILAPVIARLTDELRGLA